jgi:hypothetical protein
LFHNSLGKTERFIYVNDFTLPFDDLVVNRMRTTTKLKKILEKNTVGISLGIDGWSIAVISVHKPIKRINFNDTSFSKVVDKAFRWVNSK